MKVIFLDIDGVLITRMFHKGDDIFPTEIGLLNTRCLSLLESAILESEAKIVIISLQRNGMKVEEMRKVLSTYTNIANAILDFTPHGKSRESEIEEWLEKRDLRSYVIIDDIESHYKKYRNKLVLVNEYKGINEEVITQAMKILG